MKPLLRVRRVRGLSIGSEGKVEIREERKVRVKEQREGQGLGRSALR